MAKKKPIIIEEVQLTAEQDKGMEEYWYSLPIGSVCTPGLGKGVHPDPIGKGTDIPANQDDETN